jgi:hypothetical protein
MRKAITLVAITILVLAAQVWAGGGQGSFFDGKATGVNSNMKFALHLANHAVHTCTKNVVSITDTSQIVRNVDTWITDGLDVFMVVFDYDSLSEIEYGLTWPAEWGTASTKVCVSGAITVDGIVDSGDGIAFAWASDETYTGCKIPTGHPGGNSAPFLVPSYSWIVPTGAGIIQITAEPSTNNIGGVECRWPAEGRGFEFVTKVYYAGTLQSSDPYSGPPEFATEPTTWGSIKSMFR